QTPVHPLRQLRGDPATLGTGKPSARRALPAGPPARHPLARGSGQCCRGRAVSTPPGRNAPHRTAALRVGGTAADAGDPPAGRLAAGSHRCPPLRRRFVLPAGSHEPAELTANTAALSISPTWIRFLCLRAGHAFDLRPRTQYA